MAEEIVEEVVEEEVTEETPEPTEPEIDWQKRALEAEALIVKQKQKAKKQPITNTVSDTDSKLWEIAEMIQEGYTKADADFISKNGGKEALADPNSYVSVALRSIREQRRAENAASQTNNQTGVSEVERKYTPEQLSNMSAEELEKILPHAEPQ